MVPYIIGIIFVFASESGSNFGEDPMGAFSSIAVLVSIILVFSVLLGYIFNNIIFVNQGLIYYGLREENEKHATKSEIDLIGNDSE